MLSLCWSCRVGSKTGKATESTISATYYTSAVNSATTASSDAQGRLRDKLDVSVDFPINGLV